MTSIWGLFQTFFLFFQSFVSKFDQKGLRFFILLWLERTYDRLELYLPKRFCELLKRHFPENFPEYPMKQQCIGYLMAYAAGSDESIGWWRVKALASSGSTRTKVEYTSRYLWLVVAKGEKAERVPPVIGHSQRPSNISSETNPIGNYEAAQLKQGPSLTQTSYLVNWNGTLALDRVLDQKKANVCYAISMTRQLTALLRLKGILGPQESLSIQFVINEAGRLLFNQESRREWKGWIYQLEMLTPLFTQNGIVLEDLVDLTYDLESINPVFREGVRRFKATKLVNHYLASYANDETFEKTLSSFLVESPVTVVVPSYESFGRTAGTEIYNPTEADVSTIPRCYHAMLLTGEGHDENGNQFWEVQDSAGDERRGDRGFVRIAKGKGFIHQFVEMSINVDILSLS